MVVGNKAFGLTPDQVMQMSYFLLMTMLIDYNVMNEREDKEEKKSVKGGSGMALARAMGGAL